MGFQVIEAITRQAHVLFVDRLMFAHEYFLTKLLSLSHILLVLNVTSCEKVQLDRVFKRICIDLLFLHDLTTVFVVKAHRLYYAVALLFDFFALTSFIEVSLRARSVKVTNLQGEAQVVEIRDWLAVDGTKVIDLELSHRHLTEIIASS